MVSPQTSRLVANLHHKQSSSTPHKDRHHHRHQTEYHLRGTSMACDRTFDSALHASSEPSFCSQQNRRTPRSLPPSDHQTLRLSDSQAARLSSCQTRELKLLRLLRRGPSVAFVAFSTLYKLHCEEVLL